MQPSMLNDIQIWWWCLTNLWHIPMFLFTGTMICCWGIEELAHNCFMWQWPGLARLDKHGAHDYFMPQWFSRRSFLFRAERGNLLQKHRLSAGCHMRIVHLKMQNCVGKFTRTMRISQSCKTSQPSRWSREIRKTRATKQRSSIDVFI